MTTRDLIEFCLIHEEEIKQAVFERRNDAGSGKSGGNGSGHCLVSDTTANTAIRRVEEVPCVIVEYGTALNGRRDSLTLRHPERWLKVTAWTKEHYMGNKQGDLIRMKYCNGMTRGEICKAIGVGTSIYHVMLNDIFAFAEGIATGIGVVAPRH